MAAAVCAAIAFGFALAPSRRSTGSGRVASSPGRGGSSASGGTPFDPARETRAVDRVLAYTAYVRLGSHRVREVALTFDDGPSEYTRAILRILRRTHTPATFFVIGRQASSYPRLIAAEARAGFEIGDHTETHPPLASLPQGGQANQFATAADAIRRAGGPSPRLLRPPYGSFDSSTLAVLRQQGMLLVLWSADTKDYARPGVAKIVYTALSGAQPGAIILMHDGGGDRRQTVAALPRIIRGLRRHGYRLVTVAQLLAGDPPPPGQPPPHPLSGGV
jgi:peptidoglycan/xylan/chitin deacetylase (PgdA/CDA1 family)